MLKDVVQLTETIGIRILGMAIEGFALVVIGRILYYKARDNGWLK